MIQNMAAQRGVFLLSAIYLGTLAYSAPTQYNVGVGIADITGPAADVNMMGYSNPSQTAHGIHLRSFSRAFIFSDSGMKKRVVYVNLDSCMVSQVIKLGVIEKLNSTYGDLYTVRNVLLSGTHTSSAAGGYNEYLFYDISAYGFVKETYDAMVEGIVLSIKRAHENMKPANMYVNSGELLDSSINRSPSAYLLNPKDERDRYDSDVDKTMTVLKIVDADDQPIGMLSWFAVDCTSMNNSNKLLSSDNKGYASLLFEEAINGDSVLPGKGQFVAAFAQSNLGDVSPNTKGPHCRSTGLPCDTNNQTCFGSLCVASGPGKDMFESTKIIGTNQYKKAMELFVSATIPVSGPVDFRHTYTDMAKQDLGKNKTTCKPAIGRSYEDGTTDAPGMMDYDTGQSECNKAHKPYAWEPTIVDTQILQLGQVIVIAVPAEFTTMSGRRTRNAVARSLLNADFPEPPVPIIAGLANDYGDHVTTFEEYQEQRFEGGSTIYGPYTLDAFMQVYNNLSKALAKGSPVAPGPNPPNLLEDQFSYLSPTRVDRTPLGKQFGQALLQPLPNYKGNDRVTVKFVGASPRNNRKAESTFLEVQRKVGDAWKVEYTDAHWNTRFEWKAKLFGESDITIHWDIPSNATSGVYRIVYYGDHKSFRETITPFNGTSHEFNLGSVKQEHHTGKETKVNKLQETDVNKLRETDVNKGVMHMEQKDESDWIKDFSNEEKAEEELVWKMH